MNHLHSLFSLHNSLDSQMSIFLHKPTKLLATSSSSMFKTLFFSATPLHRLLCHKNSTRTKLSMLPTSLLSFQVHRPIHSFKVLAMTEETTTSTKQAYKHTNRLAFEQSPYLLQHAHNPVNWYPWAEEAFEEARKLDVPIFLSSNLSSSVDSPRPKTIGFIIHLLRRLISNFGKDSPIK